MELEGRTAVVTGAASGIGLALCRRFLDHSMQVVMADIEEPVLAAAAEPLLAAGGRVLPVVCDVSEPAAVAALRDEALRAFGAVHVLCNNAGVASGGQSIATSPEVWQWVVGVNLLGVAYGISAFAPLMIEQGEGHIVNTASEAGLCPTPLLGSYHATKYAVVGLSESLSLELAGTGVGVSCLCPELVDTKIFESTRNAPAATGLPRDEIMRRLGEALGQAVDAIQAEMAKMGTPVTLRADAEKKPVEEVYQRFHHEFLDLFQKTGIAYDHASAGILQIFQTDEEEPRTAEPRVGALLRESGGKSARCPPDAVKIAGRFEHGAEHAFTRAIAAFRRGKIGAEQTAPGKRGQGQGHR